MQILAALLACFVAATHVDSNAQESRPAHSAESAPARPLEYPPTFPFSASRATAGKELRELIDEWPKLVAQSEADEREMVATKKRFEERFAGKRAESRPESGPALPTSLLPRATSMEWMWFMSLSGVVDGARPLWALKSWGPEHVDHGALVAKFLSFRDDAPKLEFKLDAHAHNHAQLETLVRWYWACIDQTDVFAKMIFSMDDGPFVGVAAEPAVELETVATRKLGDSMQLELCTRDGAPEPFAFRLVRDNAIAWTRIISDSPACTVRHAELTGEAGDAGVYGWVVPFAVKWSGGYERASLYLTPAGDFRFFYLSW